MKHDMTMEDKFKAIQKILEEASPKEHTTGVLLSVGHYNLWVFVSNEHWWGDVKNIALGSKIIDCESVCIDLDECGYGYISLERHPLFRKDYAEYHDGKPMPIQKLYDLIHYLLRLDRLVAFT